MSFSLSISIISNSNNFYNLNFTIFTVITLNIFFFNKKFYKDLDKLSICFMQILEETVEVFSVVNFETSIAFVLRFLKMHN